MHPPLFVEVSVKVTIPAAVSAVLGMYIVDKKLAPGTYAPVPEQDQIPVVVPPETVPASDVFALLPQTVWSVPAETEILGVIVSE
jgi:type IV secretory pathway protease TraF